MLEARQLLVKERRVSSAFSQSAITIHQMVTRYSTLVYRYIRDLHTIHRFESTPAIKGITKENKKKRGISSQRVSLTIYFESCFHLYHSEHPIWTAASRTFGIVSRLCTHFPRSPKLPPPPLLCIRHEAVEKLCASRRMYLYIYLLLHWIIYF